jgi:hypothetical protein
MSEQAVDKVVSASVSARHTYRILGERGTIHYKEQPIPQTRVVPLMSLRDGA